MTYKKELRLFTSMSITPLTGMEDVRIVLKVSRPSPKVILNGQSKFRVKILKRLLCFICKGAIIGSAYPETGEEK